MYVILSGVDFFSIFFKLKFSRLRRGLQIVRDGFVDNVLLYLRVGVQTLTVHLFTLKR